MAMVSEIGHCWNPFPFCQNEASYAASDHFDPLPDSILLLIFNKLADIKALGRCCAVSKRFKAVAIQVENVVIKVDCVISGEDNSIIVKGKGLLSHFVKFVMSSLVKPLQALQNLIGPKKLLLPEVSHHSPGEVLKIFKEVRHLKIELPGGELGLEEGVLLKWRAEFSSTLENCIILGASSTVNYKQDKTGWNFEPEKEQNSSTTQGLSSAQDAEHGSPERDATGVIPEAFYTNGGLKLRVVWTISSLIAASARHFLLQQIVCDHPTLESLVLTDADGQGTLCMNKQQLMDFRSKPLAASGTSNRTQIPALKMKLWYAAHLDLPGGTGLQGATLVAIRPSDQPVRKESENFVSGAFEEPLNAAATVLAKRRTYLLEMNSF